MSDMKIDAPAVEQIVQGYAERGLFRSLHATTAAGVARYEFIWHYDRKFDLRVDPAAQRVWFEQIFPRIALQDSLVAEMTAFINGVMSDDTPLHRRVDQRKARLSIDIPTGGQDAAVSIAVIDGDLDYAVRKIVQAVNEIYFSFLPNAAHYEYQVRTLGLSPDAITFA